MKGIWDSMTNSLRVRGIKHEKYYTGHSFILKVLTKDYEKTVDALKAHYYGIVNSIEEDGYIRVLAKQKEN